METQPTQEHDNLDNINPSDDKNRVEDQPSKESDILDLSKLGKFKFEGREMTFDDLKKSYMLHSDYTKKTQEIAQERKYTDNLQADLNAVKSNPSLVGKFKEIYPEKYHRLLDFVYQDRGQDREQTGGVNLPPEIQSKLSKMEQFISAQEQREYEQEVKAQELKLEKMEAKMGEKYPFAKPILVYSKVQALMDQEQLSSEDITDKVWDDAWKSVNDELKSFLDERQKKNFQGQKQANQKASDIGAGGGTPGEAPKKLKLSEVADYAIADLKRQQGS